MILDKPTRFDEYRSEDVAQVLAACLYVATKLGDFLDDTVVVGGLVPSLLVDQEHLPEGVEGHAGTMDLDVGLALAIMNQDRYKTLTQRLRDAGFAPTTNEQGNLTLQRWTIEHGNTVTVDFLIAPSSEDEAGGSLFHIEQDFAAVVTPGLHLAFSDRRRVGINGTTLFGEQATRDIWVCGPGAYVVLKALAFNNRGENKDAYDLYYVLRSVGVEETATCLRPLLEDGKAREALSIIRRDFIAHDGVGPSRVAEFLTGGSDDEVQADVVGFVQGFLDRCN